MPRCLVFGDSNSYGWPPKWRRGETVVWPGNTAWPKVMAAELGPDWDVVTDALPGRLTVHDDSVEGGMRNGLTVLQSALYAHGPVDLFCDWIRNLKICWTIDRIRKDQWYDKSYFGHSTCTC